MSNTELELELDLESESESVQTHRTFQNDDCYEKLQELYLDTETADVRFSFGSTRNDDTGTQVAAHKILLAARSDVFKAMFYGTMKESGNIHVTDTSEGAFMEFLQYFYMGNVKLSAEHVEEVLYLGQKYNVEKCVNDCFEFLIDFVDNENVCNRLHLAILYGHKPLMKTCEKRILMNTAAVFKSAGFLACDRQLLKHIFEMGLISCPETKVFEAMMSWVKAKSKQDVLSKALVEAHLGDLFYEIRLAAMKIEEFCALAKQYDSVLSSHYKIITNIIVLNEESDRFKTSPRTIKWNLGATLNCNRLYTEIEIEEKFELKKFYETKFSTNKSLVLDCFTCSRIVNENDRELEYDLGANVKIYEYCDMECTSGYLLMEMEANLKSENVRVSLPQPVIVKPRLFYVIQIGPLFGKHFYYSNESLHRKKLGSGIVINFYDYDPDDVDSSDDDDNGNNDIVYDENEDDDESGSSDYDSHSDHDSGSDTDSNDDYVELDQAALIRELEFKRIEM